MKACKIIPFPFKGRKKISPARLYTLRVYLTQGPFGERQVGQEIYRTIQILGTQTFEDLHQAIFVAFGREENRPYKFSFSNGPCDRNGPQYVPGSALVADFQGATHVAGDTRETTLDSLTLTENMAFAYRFGDEPQWCHLVHILSVESACPKQKYPLMVEVVGDAPPEDPFLEDGADPLSEGIGPEMFSEFMEALQIRRRIGIENKPLSGRTRLHPALNKLPVVWVKGIGLQLGVPGQGKRQNVTMIGDFLKDPMNQAMVWGQLPLPSREMLHWILVEQGGWVSVNKLFKKFGEDDDVSWWWNEGQTPVTPLGLLRLHGIVYIGKAHQKRRKIKIATVPLELREGFKTCAMSPMAFRDAPPMPEEKITEDVLDGILSQGHCGQAVNVADLLNEIESIGLEEFLQRGPFTKETEIAYTRMLGRIRRSPSAFSKGALREFLDRIIRAGNAWSRLTAYKFGLRIFGNSFVEVALNDESGMVREWAKKLLDVSQEELF